MRILYISARQCWPPNSGGKLRDHRLLLALGQASDLTYIYYAEPGVQPVTPSDIPVCRRIVSVPRPARYRPGKIVRGLLGPWPLPVVNYTSPAMIDAIRSVLRQDRFDLVHLDSLHLAACEAAVRSELGRSAIIYGWHDVASELMWRYSQMPISLARRTYARFTARRLERAEAAILDTAFGHVVCSERERVSLLARSPKARIAVIENGVDTGAFKPPNRNSELTRIVFVGAMHYYANIDAVTWFARQIWPAMHQRFPRYRFTIVGADPKPEVRALGDLPGIEVTGTVPDVRPFYQEALAAVVPLRVGTGTRLKILEAMAAGVPVISTELGAEGLEVTPGRDILIPGSEPEWLPALESLCTESSVGGATRSEELAQAGRKLVCTQYDWEIIGRKLAELYEDWMRSR